MKTTQLLSILLKVSILVSCLCICTAHDDHDHHGQEPPSFKYSRAANVEAASKPNQAHSEHAHQHGPGCGHSHGGGHSHNKAAETHSHQHHIEETEAPRNYKIFFFSKTYDIII